MTNKLIERKMITAGLYNYSIQTDKGVRVYMVYRSDERHGRWIYKRLTESTPMVSYDTHAGAELAMYKELGI